MKLPDPSTEPSFSPAVQTIAVVGGKGGIGKSVVAVNLATVLGANEHDVLLVDAGLEMGNGLFSNLHTSADTLIVDVAPGLPESVVSFSRAVREVQVYAALARLVNHYMDVLLDYCGSIPFDSQLKTAVCQQETVVKAFPRSPSALAFRKLGARVARWPISRTSFGHIDFFVERSVQTAESTR